MKGQQLIMVLVFGFVALIIYSALIPSINTIIDDVVPEVDSATALLIQLIPFFFIIAIIGFIINGMRPAGRFVQSVAG